MSKAPLSSKLKCASTFQFLRRATLLTLKNLSLANMLVSKLIMARSTTVFLKTSYAVGVFLARQPTARAVSIADGLKNLLVLSIFVSLANMLVSKLIMARSTANRGLLCGLFEGGFIVPPKFISLLWVSMAIHTPTH